MPDYLSFLEVNQFYHIYNRANGSEQLFLSDDNYTYFLKKYLQYISPIADTYVYCLMPNHFHFLIRVKDERSLLSLQGFETLPRQTGFENLSDVELSNKLSKIFSNFFNAYTKAFNKQNARKGSLFMRPFKRKKITSEEYLRNTINYIHQNPVSHGFVKELQQWKYSSYNSFLDNKPSQLCTKEVFDIFGSKANFMTYHSLEDLES